MRQRILRVVGNAIYCIIKNLSDFPAVKELWKSVTTWRNYHHNRVAHFLRHSVFQPNPETQCSSVHNQHSGFIDTFL